MKNNRKRKSNNSKKKVALTLNKKLHDENWIRQELAKGKTAQDILKVSYEDMEEFYAAACLFFEKEKYADAANTYHFLVTMNPNIHEYWLGLAMSTQMCGDYEGALQAYEMANLNEIDSPVAYFYLAKCLYALHDQENALFALDLVVEIAADKEEFQDLKMQAMKSRSVLLGRDIL